MKYANLYQDALSENFPGMVVHASMMGAIDNRISKNRKFLERSKLLILAQNMLFSSCYIVLHRF